MPSQEHPKPARAANENSPFGYEPFRWHWVPWLGLVFVCAVALGVLLAKLARDGTLLSGWFKVWPWP